MKIAVVGNSGRSGWLAQLARRHHVGRHAGALRDAEIVLMMVAAADGVEPALQSVLAVNPHAALVLNTPVPVGFTDEMRGRYPAANLISLPDCPGQLVLGVPRDDLRAMTAAAVLVQIWQECGLPGAAQPQIMAPQAAETVAMFIQHYQDVRANFFRDLRAFAESQHLDHAAILAAVSTDPRIGAPV